MVRKPHIAASATSTLMDEAIRYVLTTHAEEGAWATHRESTRAQICTKRKDLSLRPFFAVSKVTVTCCFGRCGTAGELPSQRTTCQQFQFPGEQEPGATREGCRSPSPCSTASTLATFSICDIYKVLICQKKKSVRLSNPSFFYFKTRSRIILIASVTFVIDALQIRSHRPCCACSICICECMGPGSLAAACRAPGRATLSHLELGWQLALV